MIRARFRLLFCVALIAAASGCATSFQKASENLMGLQQQLNRGADAASLRPQFAKLATEALAAAKKSNGHLDDTVAWYRVAAVAAAEAGPQGSATLFDAVDGGKAACERLPQKDASRPTDCGLIRLSLPVGVASDLAGKLEELNAQRHGQKLPAAKLPEVSDLYDGFATQAGKVAEIRAGMVAPVVPEGLKQTADAYRRSMYCWALESYSLAFDVEGTTPQSLAGLTARKTVLRTQTEQALGPIHCDELSKPPALR